MRYGIPTSLLSNDGPHFASRFFAALYYFLGTIITTTTTYHMKSNGQKERYDKTIVARHRKYVDQNKYNWDEFFNH